MKNLFKTEDELRQAREALAHVLGLYVNRQTKSKFICINLLEYYFAGERTDERRRINDLLVKCIRDEIYPYSTVESFLTNNEAAEVDDIDPEVTHYYRSGLLAKLLKELI